MRIGYKIKEIRKNIRISQSKLASKVGISNSYLCDIEAGRKRISVETLIKIADILEIEDLNVLFDRKPV